VSCGGIDDVNSAETIDGPDRKQHIFFGMRKTTRWVWTDAFMRPAISDL
jgi:hypothetical protein